MALRKQAVAWVAAGTMAVTAAAPVFAQSSYQSTTTQRTETRTNTAPMPSDDDVSYFGLGVRLGYGSMRLSAGAAPVVGAQLQEAIDEANSQIPPGSGITPYSLSRLDLNASFFQVVPTIHLGGSDYFFKFDIPIGISSQFTSFGLGIYPINWGFHVPQVRLMPYVSAGLTFNYAMSKGFDAVGGTGTIPADAVGGMVQAGRLAVGTHFFPLDGLSLSVELGLTPYTVGILIDSAKLDAATNQSPPGDPSDAVRGGAGFTWDLAIGVHWM